MPGLIESNQVGKRQDLSDYITNIEREETPLLTELPKDTVNQSTFETQVDDYGSTDDIDGVGTSEDAGEFKNMTENRGLVTNQVMKMRENIMVDDFAENVNENPALAQGEYVEAVRKGIVRLKFRMEKLLQSRVESSKQENGRKFRTCSIGGFIKAGAPVGSQSVPERFRTPAAQIYTGTLANFTEDSARAILKEIFESTNGKGQFKAFVGSDLKEAFSLMQIYRPDRAGSTTIRRMNDSAGTTIESVVDILVGDFGRIDLIPSTRVRYFDANGFDKTATTQAQRRGSGLILDMKTWGLAHKRKPGHKQLQDEGGGPRGIVDVIFGLRCKSPKANGAVFIA